jgi:hypothetical protein
MKKVIRLTENDLILLVKRIIKEQHSNEELSRNYKKGVMGHRGHWYDEDDRPINVDDFEYDEELEFGPDDFDEYISNTEKDFPKNRWPFNVRSVDDDKDRSIGKGYYDRYTKDSPIKLRKRRM